MPSARPRWFADSRKQDGPSHPQLGIVASPYGSPRPLTGAAERLDQKKIKSSESKLRAMAAWQQAAWRYYDQIGELKFAFNLVGQVASRVNVYPAYVQDIGAIPLSTQTIQDDFESFAKKQEMAGTPVSETGMLAACQIAEDTVHRLLPRGQQGQFLHLAALNFSVAGEMYVLWNPRTERFEVASIDEVVQGSRRGTYELKQSQQRPEKIELPEGNYLARIWRSHPRYSQDAESTMLGVLDACEQFVLVDQAVRQITRSHMSAGIVFVPDSTVSLTGETVEQAIIAATTQPVEDETSAFQVVPLILQGDPEKGKMQRVDLSRQIDEQLLNVQDRALERILRGIDVPKDIVAGLSDIKYANGLLIDDNLYRAHIEPLMMLICDALTQAYYQPALRKAGVDPELVDRFVLWYDPSAVVARPDKSQAANEGVDRGLISDAAWRRTRGFSEQDAPTEEDNVRRLAKRSQVPPEMSSTLIESQAPEFFGLSRKQAQAEAGLPDAVSQLLEGEVQQSTSEEPLPQEGSPLDRALSGGEVTPGGNQPPTR